jgi:hypothetical protein
LPWQASWKSAMQLMWIGWPGDEVDYERQPDVKKRLVEETGYVPVFLTRCVWLRAPC